MKKILSFSLHSADDFRMKWVSLLIFVSLLSSTNAIGEETCESRISNINREIRHYEKLRDSAIDPSIITRRNKEIADLESKRVNLSIKCDDDKVENEKLGSEYRECVKKMNSKEAPGVYKWDRYLKQCVENEKETAAGECSEADRLRGSKLNGEACQEASSTIRDVAAQQDGIGTTTQAAATAYSSMQAMQATGAQEDALARQQKILQTMALAKIATGGLALSGAAQLKSAASDAEGAAVEIGGAHGRIDSLCKKEVEKKEEEFLRSIERSGPYDPKVGSTSDEMHRECFNRHAASSVSREALSYDTLLTMKEAARQSQAQADKANSMAKASLITGMADTLVGLQALALSRQTQQKQQMMLPPVALPPGYQFPGARGGSGASAGGLVMGDANNLPADYGLAEGGGEGGLAIGGGAPGNSVRGPKFAVNNGAGTYKAGKSVVSRAGGGGGGGGRGGRGGDGSGGSRTPPRMRSGVDEYRLPAGGDGPGGKGVARNSGKAGENNAFAEALAKLFPQSTDGKPVIEAPRDLASAGDAITEDAIVGSEVYAADLSIFQQISTRYRELNSAGKL